MANEDKQIMLTIPDEQLNNAYQKLYKTLISSEKKYVLDRLHDLLYVFGSISYFDKENKKIFKKMRNDIQKNIEEKFVSDFLSKNNSGSYLQFIDGETTSFKMVYLFDAYIFSIKRCIDFLIKLPVSCFVPGNINENDVKRLSMNDFIKFVKKDSQKPVVLAVKEKMPKILDLIDSLTSWIAFLTNKRDGLTHRFAYKQIFFRIAVEIDSEKKDWQIISWDFSTSPELTEQINAILPIDDDKIILGKNNVEAIVKDSTNRMKGLLIEFIDIVNDFYIVK